MASGAGLGGNYRANGVEVKPVVRVEWERLTFERRKITPGLQQDSRLQTLAGWRPSELVIALTQALWTTNGASLDTRLAQVQA